MVLVATACGSDGCSEGNGDGSDGMRKCLAVIDEETYLKNIN